MTRGATFGSLRGKGTLLSFGALLIGVLATWLWMGSQAAWKAHLDRSFVTGLALYETLVHGTPPPDGVIVETLQPDRLPPGFNSIPRPGSDAALPHITTVSVILDPTAAISGARLQLQIASPDIRYPVSGIAPDETLSAAAKVGNVTRLLATFCSAPVVYARLDQKAWHRIEGNAVWGCSAAPTDLRIAALALLALGIALCLTQVHEIAAQFTRVADALRWRGHHGRHDPLEETGPQELRDIVRTVNSYLAAERDRLQQRAMVLSGVSHDLGTPATRLRLRTALIEDQDLRGKLEADIDQMTGMIDSVLTYTRAEMSAEDSVSLSLTSLVESVVADYEDVGEPVFLKETERLHIGTGRTVFGGGSGSRLMPGDDARRVLVKARPVALRRAISNLIDNSLKYGRRATVSIRADADTASILIEDESTEISEDQLNMLTGPFQRGENAGVVSGVGLGLTIVSTIARLHGGDLVFERLHSGLRASLTICRR